MLRFVPQNNPLRKFLIIYNEKFIVIGNNNFSVEHLYAKEKLLGFTNVKLVSLVTDS